MAYVTVVTGTAITASWGNASVRDQVVTPFTDSAARASAITAPVAGMVTVLTSSTPPSVEYYNGSAWEPVTVPIATDSTARATAIPTPIDGMLSVLKTTDRVDVYNGASWSALVAPSNGALTAWTPVVVQGATPTLTNTYSTYQRTGRMIQFSSVVTLTSGGTAANVVTISLPVTAVALSLHSIIGQGHITDTSAVLRYPAELVYATTTTAKFGFTDGSGGGVVEPSYLGVTGFTAALASTDVISVNGYYEAAADG